MAGWSLPRRWRTALEQAQRDAAMLMRSVRGRRAPFLVPRQAGAAGAQHSGAQGAAQVGAQQLGAGAQQVASGAQQSPYPP